MNLAGSFETRLTAANKHAKLREKEGAFMSSAEPLMKPEECAFILVDYQAGLAFGVESIGRQIVLNNAVALARTAVVFNVPVVISTSASRVYSGPLLPTVQEALPSVQAIERKNMTFGKTTRYTPR